MGSHRFVSLLQAAAIAVVLACVGPAAHAQNVTWTGTSSSLWSDTSNWSTLAAPPSGAFLFFSGGASGTTTSNNDSSPLTLSSLTFLDNTFTGPLTLSGSALTLSATTTTGASFARSTGSLVTVTQANHGLVTGQFVTFTSSQTNYNTVGRVTVVDANTFTYTGVSSGAVSTVTGTYTPATINNLNTTAGRNVTIGNNLSLSNAQVWASASNAFAITIVSGNLSGAGNLTIAGGVNSGTTGSPLPNFRLTGNNSSYTGTISYIGSGQGLLLGSPAAMTGGLITFENGTVGVDNLWLTAGSGTYTFGIATSLTSGSGARVLFSRNGAQRPSGIRLTGGDVYWNPDGLQNYDWSGTGPGSNDPSVGSIQVTGGVDPTTSNPYRLYLGQENGTFTISGGGKRIGGGSGTEGRVTLLSALRSSTDTIARTLEVDVPVLTLSASAVSQSGTLNVQVGNLVGTDSGLEISNVNQLPNGNLNLASTTGTLGGVLILNNMGSSFNRPYGSGTGQWQITGPNNSGSANWAGFAATVSSATIPNQASGTSAFDRNFSLGYGLRNPNGTLYADKGVTIAQNTTLTDTRLVSVAANGMDGFGMSGTAGPKVPGPNVLNEISGTLSGTGALVVLGMGNNAVTVRGILTLSGSNSWEGAPSSSLQGPNSAGPGGLIAHQSFVRFARPESLPTGANSGTSYIAATRPILSGAAAGLLFTGGGATNVDYDLSDKYRFLLGGPNVGAPSVSNTVFLTFGADGGKVTVKGSSLLLNVFSIATTGTLNSSFNVVEGSELTLGTGGAPFNLIPTTGSSAAGTPTSYSDATVGQRWLYKFGEGPLVLGNVSYTDVALSGSNTQSFFRWQIGGSGSSSRTGVPEGPVRGLSVSSTAANSSNSLRGFSVTLAGGVYEVDNSLGTSGTLSAGAGSFTAETTFVWATGGGGGGFSAYGGDVEVILSSGANPWIRWDSAFGTNPLIFGSRTANKIITLTTPLSLYTASATREIRVLDNPDTSSDYAVISGTMQNNITGGNFNKTGPGLLELRAANTFTGTATVSEGTLLLANNLALQNAFLNTSGTGLVAMSGSVTTPTFGGLVGSGNLSTVFGSSYSTLTSITLNRTGALTGTSTYTAAITDGASGMAITKSGTGVQELTGANSYTGTTTITAGTLRLGIANLPGNIANSAGLEILQASVTTGTASGVISGTGSLTMINGGVVRLANTANTYTGVTTISSGVLEVAALANAGSNSPLGAPTGASATIGLGSSTTSGTLSYVGAGAASTNRSFSLAGNGGIAANGGDALTISGTVTGAATNFTLSGTSTALNSLPSIDASVASVTKSGAGTWRLTGNSSYSGQLRVLDGRVIVGSVGQTGPSPFGGDANVLPLVGDSSATTGTAGLLVESGTVSRGLAVNTGSNQVVVLGGYGAGNSRFNSVGTDIRLGRDVTLQASNSGTVEFASTWQDSTGGTSPAVNFTIGSLGNAGEVVFAASVPASIQSVKVVAGTLAINSDNRMDPGTPMTLGSAFSNGTFNLRTFSQRLSNLSFTGTGSTVSSMAAGTLRLFNNGGTAAVNVVGTGHQISASVALDDNSTFDVAASARLAVSGVIGTGSSGARSLTKTGLGTLELSGQNSYTGNTAVNQGTLVVNGRLAEGALSVAAGATLMGSGTIGGNATIAGIHSPGNSPGIETFSTNLTYTGGTSQVIWELWGNTDSLGSRGALYDGINVGGTLDFAALTTLTLNFGGTGVGVVDWDNAFWSESRQWTLFTVTGTTTNFSNFQLANNPASWVDSTGEAFSASSRNTNTFNVVQSSNNIVLQYVPEPTAVTLALIGIAASVYVASRRRS